MGIQLRRMGCVADIVAVLLLMISDYLDLGRVLTNTYGDIIGMQRVVVELGYERNGHPTGWIV